MPKEVGGEWSVEVSETVHGSSAVSGRAAADRRIPSYDNGRAKLGVRQRRCKLRSEGVVGRRPRLGAHR